MRVSHTAGIVALSLTFAGCSTPLTISSQVSTFHELGSVQGRTFVMVPHESQKTDLEYKAYAKLLASGLTRKGMIETSAVTTADYAVLMSYGIDNGKTELSSRPLIGQTGVMSSTTYGQINRAGSFNATTYNTPTYGVIGTATDSNTVYTRYLQVDVLDPKSKDGDEKYPALYLGKVKSSGSFSQLPRVMPYMVNALAKDFPGKSGEAKTVDEIMN